MREIGLNPPPFNTQRGEGLAPCRPQGGVKLFCVGLILISFAVGLAPCRFQGGVKGRALHNNPNPALGVPDSHVGAAKMVQYNAYLPWEPGVSW
jgi:hypothetical protein